MSVNPDLVTDVSVVVVVQSTTLVPPLEEPIAYSYLDIPETVSVKAGQTADSVESEPVWAISSPVPSFTIVPTGAVKSMVTPSPLATTDRFPATSVARTLK